jgi:hypothetical protein
MGEVVMTGQHIWHIKVRRTGQAEAEIAEIQLDRRRPPAHDEVIDVSVKRKSVRAKIVAFNTSTSGSTATYSIQAVEEHEGNLPGHREADEDDF